MGGSNRGRKLPILKKKRQLTNKCTVQHTEKQMHLIGKKFTFHYRNLFFGVDVEINYI